MPVRALEDLEVQSSVPKGLFAVGIVLDDLPEAVPGLLVDGEEGVLVAERVEVKVVCHG